MNQSDLPTMSQTNPNVATATTSVEASPDQEKKQLDGLAKSGTEVLVSQPQQQHYKIVKVRKPDGTIVKVRRLITAEEAAQAQSSPTKPKVAATTTVAEKKPNSETVIIKSIRDTEGATAASPPPAKVAAPRNESPAITTTEQSDSTVTTPTVKVSTKNITETKPAESSKPMESSIPSKTDRVLDTATRGTRLYRGIHRLHKGSSRFIRVFAPDWDINDLQDGDEEISDNDDENDSEHYDSDDENSRNQHQSTPAQNSDSKVISKEIGNAAAANIATVKTPRQQSDDAIPKTVNKPTGAKTAVVSVTEILKQDVEKGSLEKPTDAAAEGRKLQRHYRDWSRYIVYAIMLIFPLLFMVVGILVHFRDGKDPYNAYGKGTTQALDVAVSVWPIVFAGIVAQSLRAYATYKVERGVQLMTLEQLVNSNSVASSIKQPFLLRRFNLITVALLVLWGLSPLATQAMQRISPVVSILLTEPVNQLYVNTTQNNANYLSASPDDFNKVQGAFNRLYTASFVPQPHLYGSDPYGNALIPIPNSSEWSYTDPSNSSFNGPYISAYGIAVATELEDSRASYFDDTSFDEGSSDEDNLSYTYNVTIQAAYLVFRCTDLTIITRNDDTYKDLFQSNGGSSEKTLFLNMTAMIDSRKGALHFASQITLNSTTEKTIPKTNINTTYAYTSCLFDRNFTEAHISCWADQCITSAVRQITPNISGSFNSGDNNWVDGIIGSSGQVQYPTATDTEQYLAKLGGQTGSSINLNEIDHNAFETGLSHIMNTFWYIGFAPNYIAATLYNDTGAVNPDLHPETLRIPSYAAGDRYTFVDQFQTHKGWLAVLLLCSTFLLLAGIFSIWWDARTVSPDVLGFASSVVRKSKYVQLPKVDNAASGAERTRALGKVRVMMQDVKPTAEVGRIALGTAHPNAKRLAPGRVYR